MSPRVPLSACYPRPKRRWALPVRGAEQMLAANPRIADGGFYVALTLGDGKRIEEALRESPDLAMKAGGPCHWEPLLYVCFSRFSTGTSRLAESMATAARVLLGYGADPDSSFISKDWPDHPHLSCVYAAGLNNNPALALALLEAGAHPNDGERSTIRPNTEIWPP